MHGALLSPRAVSKAKVALLRTSARSVLRDYHRLLNLADYQQALPKDADTALAISLGWHFFYPASSTTPWQLEGVIRAMQQDGYNSDLIHACQHASAVIDAPGGAREQADRCVRRRPAAKRASPKAKSGRRARCRRVGG